MKTNRTAKSGRRITQLLKYLELIMYDRYKDETNLDHETY